MQNAMLEDFSWSRQIVMYEKVFREVASWRNAAADIARSRRQRARFQQRVAAAIRQRVTMRDLRNCDAEIHAGASAPNRARRPVSRPSSRRCAEVPGSRFCRASCTTTHGRVFRASIFCCQALDRDADRSARERVPTEVRAYMSMSARVVSSGANRISGLPAAVGLDRAADARQILPSIDLPVELGSRAPSTRRSRRAAARKLRAQHARGAPPLGPRERQAPRPPRDPEPEISDETRSASPGGPMTSTPTSRHGRGEMPAPPASAAPRCTRSGAHIPAIGAAEGFALPTRRASSANPGSAGAR